MSSRQPGVEGKHRHLDGKRQEKSKEEVNLGSKGVILPHHVGNKEAVIVDYIEPDDADQQENGAGQSVEEKFDRGVNLPWPAPNADKQIHRDKHRFPEDIEQHEIKSDKDADHGGFHDEQADHEGLDPGLDIRPACQDTERHDEGRQDD